MSQQEPQEKVVVGFDDGRRLVLLRLDREGSEPVGTNLGWEAALRAGLALQRAAAVMAVREDVSAVKWRSVAANARLDSDRFVVHGLKEIQDLEQSRQDAAEVRRGRKRKGLLPLARIKG